MKVEVYNLQGEKTKDIELSDRIFGVKAKNSVVHQVVIAQQANSRQISTHTKDRGEVRGGGKKPWKQKGTGRARHGSIRSPIWKGGGVVFGPTKDRNYDQKVNKKQKQLALAMCLSDKLANNNIAIFDKLELAEARTKALTSWLSTMKSKIAGLKDGKKFLMILEKNNEPLIRAALNLKNINTIAADSLNCLAILHYDRIITSEGAINKINAHYHKVKGAAKKNK